mmetsp:Transcript_62812/g.186881  ORF Transcript_62812/g.186881 Transcript_62812/m.186881 type:complete len:94 (-) Transcript_62812:1775-2056(-)|eukprot:7379215-Prymnesium_polylepis.1
MSSAGTALGFTGVRGKDGVLLRGVKRPPGVRGVLPGVRGVLLCGIAESISCRTLLKARMTASLLVHAILSCSCDAMSACTVAPEKLTPAGAGK